MTPRVPSDVEDASPLGNPLHFEFSGRTAPNRFLKAAMTERLSSWDPKKLEARGVPSEQLINVYRRWGEGGLGHILSGNIMVAYDQLEAAVSTTLPETHETMGSPGQHVSTDDVTRGIQSFRPMHRSKAPGLRLLPSWPAQQRQRVP